MFNIGIVGYSSTEFDVDLARDILKHILDFVITDYNNTKIISGLTNLGIPKLAYEYAISNDIITVGVACSKANEFPIFTTNETFIIGEEWGDESEFFIDMLDCLIRIGGGDQSKRECQMFLSKFPFNPIYEVDI